ncbi:MAG: alpha/beta fold hydrolase [Leptolyngbyaceae cyanobacterium MO_188.B28]|nr:alpha/beta fold hydrolase [Leptolyngbyaceae cyanobacterium MO_188.B28]
MTSQLTAPNTIEKLTWTWRGHRIQYAVQGAGPPVILIHGFGASIGHWRKNMPTLSAAGYRVFALDLLGFGDSDKPGLDYSLDLWESILKDFWAEHVQQSAVFVGNSIGGLLTLMMLANHADIASGGVLLNSAGGLNLRPDEVPFLLGLIMGAFRKLASSQLTGPVLFNQIRKKYRIRGSLRQVYGNKQAITDELVEILHRPSCDPGAQKVFASILSAPAGPRPSELLPRIHQPLLVLWGETDPWATLETAEIYQKLSRDNKGRPAVKFQSIPETGHCPHDERPEVVNPLIIEWLEAGMRHR